MGFSQAISGMNAASKQLDVIGNNIANSATVGFKSASISFADIYAGSKVGMGVKVAAVVQNFNDGTTTATNNSLDVAISGNGFFRLVDSSGQVYYTRNGQFQLDAERNIISADGLQLTGYLATGTPPKIQQGATPAPLKVSQEMLNASATTKASLQTNLNSNSKVPEKQPLNALDADTFNYSTTITTYDSLGNQRNVQLFYVKTADNQWDVHYLDGSDPTASLQKLGQMEFDSTGKLISDPDMTINLNGLNGSADNSFTLSFTNSSQQNMGKEVGSIKTPVVDGYAAGDLVGYSIANDGSLFGIYSNQQTMLLGQIAMADFANVNGLEPAGNNNWRVTLNSGAEVLGMANSGTLGSLMSGAVESSNVDMSQELVNMIVAQRNYQSNSQTIKTQDQILNTLVNLR
ncbi:MULTISPECIES: flagellar hook protein FlgE [unclassified Gilliamella]|uniref:flagellar hook protein FlgE n=1 Tax=unclassified Gilliamella TaxID=2685620 RepID=UPI002269EB7F|nr:MULTISPECIES: flagellar hook protein FlgE [unclassified Gilliamella]MCX8601734.1 flagellar hook protein FlgE [Gilliamella sp. B3722]MCX8608392.1 flagellar hook protein FlgE [Gilliamella sp. B3771]MCX8610997.1 flagellar hook protein FlgE [Gilliamella sp. B3891]MCX8613465.1 flagellar hook protein FlgE [Gilliamella sp. B3773]MCX8616379.1 flagellar hook protein FlgE [Gilliamella sp. B3770]